MNRVKQAEELEKKAAELRKEAERLEWEAENEKYQEEVTNFLRTLSPKESKIVHILLTEQDLELEALQEFLTREKDKINTSEYVVISWWENGFNNRLSTKEELIKDFEHKLNSNWDDGYTLLAFNIETGKEVKTTVRID